MPRISNRRGLYVHVRRAKCSCPSRKRRTRHLQVEHLSPKNPVGSEADRGGFSSFHAAHAAGSKALEELVENILNKDENTAGAGLAPPLPQSTQRISQFVQHIAHFRRPIKITG